MKTRKLKVNRITAFFLALTLIICPISAVTPSYAETVVSSLAVSGGYDTGYAIDSAGNAWAWGYNVNGQLGNGTNTDSKIPVAVSSLTNVEAIAAGNGTAYALLEDQTVWAWGNNNNGSLGNATKISSNLPVQVAGLTDIIQISNRQISGYALKSDGTVWSWGGNRYGQLGNGTTTDSNTPVQVTGITSATAIACTNYAAYAVVNGDVWAWGDNQHGELGIGNSITQDEPVKVSDINDVTDVAGGFYTAYALKSDGTVWAWGGNDQCACGIGTFFSGDIQSVPVAVKGLPVGITAIAAEGYGGYALDSSGHVWSWGQTGNANPRNLTADKVSDPLDSSEYLSNVISIAGGYYSGYAEKADGSVCAWGSNGHGNLGNNSLASSLVPVQVSGFGPIVSSEAEITSFILDTTAISTYGDTVTATVTGTNLTGASLSVSLDDGATTIGTVSNQTGTGADIAFDVPENISETTTKDYTVTLYLNNSATSFNHGVTVAPRGTLPVTGLYAVDQDTTYFGVDGRDFYVGWVPSVSSSVAEQAIYLLPSGTTINTTTQTPSADFTTNTDTYWTGSSSLTKDSADNALTSGNYRVYVVSKGNQEVQASAIVAVISEGITTSTMPSGTVGSAYNGTLNAAGGMEPYSWNAVGLPDGLSLNTDGTISGTPATSGTYQVVVTVLDSSGQSQSKSLAFDIADKPVKSSGGSSSTHHTVVFHSNGGTGVNSLSIISGNSLKAPPEPSKEGYTFGGWYKNAELTIAYDFKTKVTSSLTLFAKWIPEEPFKDLQGYSWAAHAINDLYQQGVVNGIESEQYGPGRSIIRGDFILMIFRAYDLSAEPSSDSVFQDVPSDSYYAEAIRAAQSLGIAQGYNGYIAPQGNLTRQDALVLIYRTLTMKGKTLPAGTTSDILKFKDGDQVSSYASTAVSAFIKAGIVEGYDGRLNPLDNISRAEIAKIFYETMQL